MQLPYYKYCQYAKDHPSIEHQTPFLEVATDGNTDVTFFIDGYHHLFTTDDSEKDTLTLFDLIPEFRCVGSPAMKHDHQCGSDSVPKSFQQLYAKYPLDTIMHCYKKKDYPCIKTIKAEDSIKVKEVNKTDYNKSNWTWEDN